MTNHKIQILRRLPAVSRFRTNLRCVTKNLEGSFLMRFFPLTRSVVVCLSLMGILVGISISFGAHARIQLQVPRSK